MRGDELGGDFRTRPLLARAGKRVSGAAHSGSVGIHVDEDDPRATLAQGSKGRVAHGAGLVDIDIW